MQRNGSRPGKVQTRRTYSGVKLTENANTLNREKCLDEYRAVVEQLEMLSVYDEELIRIHEGDIARMVDKALEHGFTINDSFWQGFIAANGTWRIVFMHDLKRKAEAEEDCTYPMANVIETLSCIAFAYKRLLND